MKNLSTCGLMGIGLFAFARVMWLWKAGYGVGAVMMSGVSFALVLIWIFRIWRDSKSYVN